MQWWRVLLGAFGGAGIGSVVTHAFHIKYDTLKLNGHSIVPNKTVDALNTILLSGAAQEVNKVVPLQ